MEELIKLIQTLIGTTKETNKTLKALSYAVIVSAIINILTIGVMIAMLVVVYRVKG